jgi:hypothetical protein
MRWGHGPRFLHTNRVRRVLFGEIRLLTHGTSPNVLAKTVPVPKLSAPSDAVWRGLYLLIYSIPMTIVAAAKYFHPTI